MPRNPRLFVPRATYHVCCRVARGEYVFDSDEEAIGWVPMGATDTLVEVAGWGRRAPGFGCGPGPRPSWGMAGYRRIDRRALMRPRRSAASSMSAISTRSSGCIVERDGLCNHLVPEMAAEKCRRVEIDLAPKQRRELVLDVNEPETDGSALLELDEDVEVASRVVVSSRD
jgi:hypothetical protein